MKVLRFLVITLALCSLPGFAAKHGFGLGVSSFSAEDDSTEVIFDIDSGPIGEIFYRMQIEAHNIVVSVGAASWDNEVPGVFSA